MLIFSRRPSASLALLQVRYALLLLLLTIAATVPAQSSNSFLYSVSSNTITITGYTGSGGTVVIPDSIAVPPFCTNYLPVTSIGSGAFANAYLTTAVLTETNLADIGDSAFSSCGYLTSVSIGNNVTNIGRSAFWNCTKLTTVQMGNNVCTIGSAAFLSAGLAGITIPDSVTTIGENAFAGTYLTNVAIPASVTNLGNYPFEICDWLTAITVDSNSPAYSSLAGVLFNKSWTTLIEYPAGLHGSYVIPDSVTALADRAFYSCDFMTAIAMGTNVANIGANAFNGCLRLTNVVVPAGVTNIGTTAFQQCVSLSAINVDTNNADYTSISGVLFDKNEKTLITYPGGAVGSYAIPDGVNNIGYYAFQAAFYITSVIIPSSVTNIADDAFQQCYDLTDVYFEGVAPTVGAYPFANSGNPTIYYLPRTAGWAATFGGQPTALWLPTIQTAGTGFGVQSNQFGFDIDWASDQIIVVEACTNLANPDWIPVATNTLTSGSSHFSEPQWINFPAHFYRVNSP